MVKLFSLQSIWRSVMKRAKKQEKTPAFAPGMDNELERGATKEEKKKGKVTKVTHLSYDEIDPS